MLKMSKVKNENIARLMQGAALGAALICLAPFGANATIVSGDVVNGATFLNFFGGNGCQGGSFASCYASQNGLNIKGASPSSSIYKINSDGTSDFGSYAAIDGTEFTINYENDILSWNYTSGMGDPAVHYFQVKQANGYALFYSASGISSWTDNILTDLGYNGLSHVAWFNGALMADSPGRGTVSSSSSSGGSTTSSSGGSTTTSSGSSSGPGGQEVPEPATLGLFGAGLLGLGLGLRRRNLF